LDTDNAEEQGAAGEGATGASLKEKPVVLDSAAATSPVAANAGTLKTATTSPLQISVEFFKSSGSLAETSWFPTVASDRRTATEPTGLQGQHAK